ncbi:hypothetical protein MANES_13G133801v8 [Manihot esculenta]|uniref:Uncharacterized protein n=1 Tax=Manihot esculenta TaxID=3983 RepID=A0ACB7GMV9_MANES|nr:hypothetical protein MANES_13G133801v8 [Manihot esculenta]
MEERREEGEMPFAGYDWKGLIVQMSLESSLFMSQLWDSSPFSYLHHCHASNLLKIVHDSLRIEILQQFGTCRFKLLLYLI